MIHTQIASQRSGGLALVAMPWPERERPSPALGVLSAYVRRERPHLKVTQYLEYLHVAEAVGPLLYRRLAENCHAGAGLLYVPALHPERTAAAREAFIRAVPQLFRRPGGQETDGGELLAHLGAAHWAGAFDMIANTLERHLLDAAERVTKDALAVGMTTSFEQLLPNLALARAIKRIKPDLAIILGGSTVLNRVGASLLALYPTIEFVVQGEGEQALTRLVDHLATGVELDTSTGILSRASLDASPPPKDDAHRHSELASLDTLPQPDYDEYAALASRYAIPWKIPYEGSRGCWWDRTSRTGNPSDTCYFCNLNIQWGAYREKSAQKIASELSALCRKYKRPAVYFVDNIIRAKGINELAQAIEDTGLQLDMFYEMRVNVRPHEFLRLVEAGLTSVLFGIEGLSSSYLKRIGKGSTAIQNLQAMRLCEELGVFHGANLITGFPGATAEEVAETARVIQSFALSFQPLDVTGFGLFIGSTVEVQAERFGVRNIRNRALYEAAFPPDVWRKIQLFELDYDSAPSEVSWAAVLEACDRWRDVYYGAGPRLLTYRDAGDFVYVEDRRFGDLRYAVFEGVQRDLYMYLLEARSTSQIVERFGKQLTSRLLEDILTGFVEDGLAFRDGARYLALAVAATPAIGARRIRRDWSEENQASQAGKSLPLVR